MSAAVPRPAATVVLVREASTGLEVFLLRRHAKSGFMANAYVFPGGRLDEADTEPALIERLEGIDPQKLCHEMRGSGSPERAAGHLIACIRETFEESGVLLATRVGGGQAIEQERAQEWRDRLNAGEVSFLDVVQSLDLVLNGSSVAYFAHWITPTAESRRYDTRFFLAVSPEGQSGVHDGHETTDSLWIAPGEALDAHAKGGLMLAPPQWFLLGKLAALSDAQSAVRWARQRAVPTVQPTIGTVDGALVIALPGDPIHEGGADPDGALRRIVMSDGRWTMPAS
ncbi:MAG: NUDIX hydrolase [Myxococcota bacterium]|nr:NUDIX hydrolase [Myxococcota bacterium]